MEKITMEEVLAKVTGANKTAIVNEDSKNQ
jgi:hypothetical protein